MRRGERILLLAVVVALVAAVGTAAGAGGQDTGSGNETVLTLEPTGETSADELSAAATAVERRLAVAGEDDAEATASDGVVTVRVDGSAVAAVSGWVSDPGAVSVVAAYPSGGDAKTATLLGPDDFGEVGEVQSQDDRWFVPIRLTDDGSETFRTRLAENGFTDEAGIDDCRY
jgi:FlaG/FlaF family flagellin (archaellin)